jgi:hypothetical protein
MKYTAYSYRAEDPWRALEPYFVIAECFLNKISSRILLYIKGRNVSMLGELAGPSHLACPSPLQCSKSSFFEHSLKIHCPKAFHISTEGGMKA